MSVIKLFIFCLSVGAISALAQDVDPSEEFPIGNGSTSDLSVQAFSHPVSGLRGEQRRQFTVGNSFFNSVWIAGPSTTTARDGLGPMYNAVSCSSCHFKDGRGRGLPETEGKVDVSLLFRIRVKGAGREVFPHPVYGEQIQPQGILGVPGEATPQVKYERIELTYTDGTLAELLKPVYEFFSLNYGPLGDRTIKSPRVAPQMIGLGFLEAIPEADILKREDPLDADGDGISGRANRVYSELFREKRLGRFGWKAGKSSLKEQNAAAFNGDIGITSPLFPEEECTSSQTDCLNAKTVEDIDEGRLNDVTAYTQLLAVPVRRNFTSLSVQRGREEFQKIGCVSCHTPSHVTGAEAASPVLANQKIYPYTDLLLHDMGEGLADDSEDFLNEEDASTREWRTPPLWGLGLISTVNGHTRYLHDGRARSLEEAILWHGGEGAAARDQFLKLAVESRTDLLEFLKSL
jgi:CxxC motif-containing protein (DUF1111 family)